MSHFGIDASSSLLELILNGDATAGGLNLSTLGLNQTLSDIGNDLYLALCTGNPGEGGVGAISNECTQSNYTDYARKAVPRYMAYNVSFRPAKQWTINQGLGQNALALNFPTCGTNDGAVITHWALCKDQSTAVTTATCILRGAIFSGGANVWKIGYYTDTTVGTFYSVAHGFNDGETIRVSKVYDDVGAFPSSGTDGLDDGDIYYIKNKTANTFELSLTGGGATLKPTVLGAISFIAAPASASVTVATNSIPSFAAGSLKLALY